MNTQEATVNLWTYTKQLVYALSSEDARVVYFAMAAIIISVTIFSGYFLNSSKTSLEKKMLYKKIKVIRLICLVLITYILFLTKLLITTGGKIDLFLSFCIIGLEIYVVYLIFKVLLISSKLSIDSLYYDSEMQKFILDYSLEIENKSKENNNYYVDYVKEINNSQIKLINDEFYYGKGKYERIHMNSNGLIVGLNKEVKRFNPDTEVYIFDVVGKYCSKNEIIGYYSNTNSEKINANDIFIINETYVPKINRYSEIFDYLFDMDYFASSVDDSNRICEYYDFLCDAKFGETEKMLCERIKNIYWNKRDKILSLSNFMSFIDHIKHLAYLHDKKSSFHLLQNIVCNYFIDLIEKNQEYTGSLQILYMFRLSSYRESDLDYYDYTMSSLLTVFYHLLKHKKYEDINLLLKEYSYTLKNDNNNRKIKLINMCFIIGIIKGVYYQYFHKIASVEELEETLLCIKKYYYIYDGSEYIKDYLYIMDNKFYTKEVFNYCFNILENHKAGIFYTDDNLHEISLLIIILDSLRTVIYLNKDINYYEKNRKYLPYFKLMNDILNREIIVNNQNEYKIKAINSSNSGFREYISTMIDSFMKIENEYIEKTSIDPSRKKDFIDALNKNGFPSTRFYQYMSEHKLILCINGVKSSKFLLNSLVSREFFFDNDFMIEQLAETFSSSYYERIANSYAFYLKEHFESKYDESDIPQENHIVFMNSDMFNRYLYSKENKHIIKNCIPLRYIDGFISVPVNDIPAIYMEADSLDSIFIEGKNVFINDLSTDDDTRNKLLLMDKSNDENELKRKVFIEFSIKVVIQKK